MHHNIITKMAYQGGNQMGLALGANSGGYKSKEWGTFLQWKTAGFMVKKGQKAGGHIVKFIAVSDKKTDKKTGKEKVVAGSRPRGYALFNREQVEPVMSMQLQAVR